MTQMTVAPNSLPVAAPAQAAAAPGTAAEAAAGDEGGIDFAAVLKAQIAQPAMGAAGTEIIAALPSYPAAEAAAERTPADGLPVVSDLAALLAGLLPSAATGTPGEPAPQSAEPVMPAAITSASIAASPVLLAQADTGAPGEDASSSSGHAARQAAEFPAQPMQVKEKTFAAPAAADPQAPIAAAEQATPAATSSTTASPIIEASTTAAPTTAPAALAAPAGHAAAPSVHVSTPVGGRGWDAEVGQKIVLLVNRQDSRAELTLTPPQLGKVEVTISVSGEQTSATFVSASPAAREALEQALPRLREILAEAGITLGQASVNAESAQRDRDDAPTAGRGGARGADDARNTDAPTQWLRRSNGLIDTFA